jgi:hypothetical protein
MSGLLAGTILVPLALPPTLGSTLGPEGICVIAAIATVWGFILFHLFCKPESDVKTIAFGTFFFTAIVGVILLLVFQEIAAGAAETDVSRGLRRPGLVTVIVFLIKGIGVCYNSALPRPLPIRAYCRLRSLAPCFP